MEISKQRDYATLTQGDIVTAIAEYVAKQHNRHAHSVLFSHGVVAGKAAISAKVVLFDDKEQAAQNNATPQADHANQPPIVR